MISGFANLGSFDGALEDELYRQLSAQFLPRWRQEVSRRDAMLEKYGRIVVRKAFNKATGALDSEVESEKRQSQLAKTVADFVDPVMTPLKRGAIDEAKTVMLPTVAPWLAAGTGTMLAIAAGLILLGRLTKRCRA